ncbi:MAG: RluA family pseudouridine synthase [Candidatus Protochlamydia sp.]|nr:RluA family pseudouridine synthase [Candidatus Protochlamydia sp.]
MPEWVVSSSDSGVKLIVFLKDRLSEKFSSRHLKRLIENNACQINGRVERFASTLLGRGDRILLTLETSPVSPFFQFEPGRILFEDDVILAYDKPSGLACEPKEILTLTKSYHSSLSLVHRLDRYTTGVLLLSKNRETLDYLVGQFKELQVKKTYQAIVDGLMEKPKGTIENYLGKIKKIPGQTIWGAVKSAHGLYAYTEWTCIKKGNGASLLVCFPKTGRTHQIRVHLAGIGHPILGDHQYGRHFECPYPASRYFLHAESIEFHHPVTGKLIKVRSNLPEDFKRAKRELFI